MKLFKKLILILLIIVLVVGVVACDDPTRPIDPPGGGDQGGGNEGGGNEGGGDQGGSDEGGSDEGGGEDVHEHTYSFVRDELTHKQKCACGDEKPSEAHDWTDTYVRNCTTYKHCTICSYLQVVATGTHDYHYVAEYVYSEESPTTVVAMTTVERCSDCGNVNTSHYGLPDVPVDVTTIGSPYSPEVGDQYFSVKLYMTRDEVYDNRLIYRHMEKTYVLPSLDHENPDFPIMTETVLGPRGERVTTRLPYVGYVFPYDVYDIDYAYSSIYLRTPAEIFTKDFTATQVPSFYNRFFNFIRFVSTLCNDGEMGVLLSFEFDTSFIYQANGYVIRAKVTVEDAGDTTARTIEELVSTIPEGADRSYSEVFSLMLGTKFDLKYLTDEDTSTVLKDGDYVYCDINIGIPMIDSVDDDAWTSLLAKDDFGMMLGMYKY